MSNLDDILQKKLDALEKGQPLDVVLGDLPVEAQELETLIRLAAAVRTVHHPEPAAEHSAALRQQVMNAARQNTRPIARPQRTIWNWFGTISVVGATGMAVLFALALIGLGFWLSDRAASTVRVESITGQAQVAVNKQATQWKNLKQGDRLHAGQRVRTLGASGANLAFFEGTRTQLDANTDLTLTQVDGAGRSLQVELTQNSGQTHYQVVPLKGSQGFFQVHTPTGTASVHGTTFDVKVKPDGYSLFAVNKGEVQVMNANGAVTLQSGQATAAGLSGALAEPNYQFNVTGSLMAIQGDTWLVSGVPFQVDEQTVITGEPDLSNTVIVDGRIQADGTHVADNITVSEDDDQNASFTGTLKSIEGDIWQVNDTSVQVDGDTELDKGLAVNDPVKVTFNLLDDGTWLALKIESLAESAEEENATPTPTSDPRAMPSYEFEPDEIETSNCAGQVEFNLTGNLANTADDAKDYAANVRLGYLIDRGGEYVSAVTLTPDRWTRIDAGQSVSFNILVVTNEKFASAKEDTEIKLRIFVASATNRPDHLNGRLTVTIVAGCRRTPTPTTTKTVTLTPGTGTPTTTPTVTGTPGTATPTATPTQTGTPTGTPPESGQCTGANPHPTGLKLARRYNVPYEEIMKWFCQHYGFGEIDLAYSLSRQSGKPVEEIFAMRASGMGWGAIKKLVASGNPAIDKNKGKDKGKKDK